MSIDPFQNDHGSPTICYGSPSSICSQIVYMTLNELKIPYENKNIDFQVSYDNLEPEYA